MCAAGEVQDISGAEREKEIGGIVDIYQRRIGNKAVLFDDVPGFPRGHRILAKIAPRCGASTSRWGSIPTPALSIWCITGAAI